MASVLLWVGIAIGVVVFLAIIGVVMFFLLKKSPKKTTLKVTEERQVLAPKAQYDLDQLYMQAAPKTSYDLDKLYM